MMHHNSLEAFHSVMNLGERQRAIWNTLVRAGPMTDRAVVEDMDLFDMNSARPRITELIKEGFAKEVGSVHCHVTGRKVRLVRAVSASERWDELNQMRLWKEAQ